MNTKVKLILGVVGLSAAILSLAIDLHGTIHDVVQFCRIVLAVTSGRAIYDGLPSNKGFH